MLLSWYAVAVRCECVLPSGPVTVGQNIADNSSLLYEGRALETRSFPIVSNLLKTALSASG